MKKFLFMGLLLAQKVQTVTFDELVRHIDTAGVAFVNFWATWCRPCVAELPILAQGQKKYPQVHWLLVSLDFPEEKKRIQHLLQTKALAHTFLLVRSDNDWIDKVNPSWAGNLPASALYQKGKQIFFQAAPISQGLVDSLMQKVLGL